jgi:hypothetical protein
MRRRRTRRTTGWSFAVTHLTCPSKSLALTVVKTVIF